MKHGDRTGADSQRPDFGFNDESDVDMLVEFEPGLGPGLIGIESTLRPRHLGI